MPTTPKTNLQNKKVLLVGLGRTTQALAQLLLRQGASITITEHAQTPQLQTTANNLRAQGIQVETGGHTQALSDNTEVVIPSPGVSPEIPLIQRAIAQGAELMGELDYAAQFAQSKIIAVTGTNGKTTTTELITAMIRDCGHTVALAGNNATPLSAAIMAEPPPDYLVLELSSYQLALAKTFHPWIAALLNITPDHLGRHGTLENYADAKLTLFAQQSPSDHAILNADDPLLRQRFTARQQVHPFSQNEKLADGIWIDGTTIRHGETEIATLDDIHIPGKHNRENVLAALAVLRAGDFALEATREALANFHGVEHRLETVATIDNVTYVNDSKATNLTSLRAALESFQRPLVLIAGGEGKGEDLDTLRELITQRVHTLITIGRDAPLFVQAYAQHVPTHTASSMAEAVQLASQHANPNDTVLLSPGCASFDHYPNFEARGHDFKTNVTMIQESSLSSLQAATPPKRPKNTNQSTH